MSSGKIEETSKSKILVKGVKAVFENGVKHHRAPSPAPVNMTSRAPLTGKAGGSSKSDSFSSYKERFEQFTAPKTDHTVAPKGNLRRTLSEDNVNKVTPSDNAVTRGRTKSNSAAEKHWIQAKTKIYEKLTEQRTQAEGQESARAANSERQRLASNAVIKTVEDKVEIASLQDRIKKYKSDVETKKMTSEKVLEINDKSSAKVKDLKSSFASPQMARKGNKGSSISALDKFKKLEHSAVEETLQPKVPLPKSIESSTRPIPVDTSRHTLPKQKKSVKQVEKLPKNTTNTDVKEKEMGKAPVRYPTGSSSKSIAFTKEKHENLTSSVVDHESALNFMVELVTAIDNEQHVPMKQLINLFEIMKKENGEMKSSIESLKTQLNKSDLTSLSESLQSKLIVSEKQLKQAQEQIEELSVYRKVLRESEERCEELEELNQQYLEEIEELKLIMNEMRDQFHDDEIHETIILQQRLDDMARSLRIIHFRLKKADAKLQETEREKETLLEEIKLLQGGTFTEEEMKRMQSLEGDLQAAKEISVELHNQLQRSEERREKVEAESVQYREEIKALNLENDRLRNNVIHLREQVNTETGSHQLSPGTALVRQGSADIDTLKSNLEASIERENDLNEQLSYAEEEAKMLRKRLRDIEHENEALTKQLKKLTHISGQKGEKNEPGLSEQIETQVIQLENAQLRHDNDQLHLHIDSMQSQIKSLQQKLVLVQEEQNEGPLSVVKNSLYYETKFELMTQEIEDLRRQLQERDNDYKKLREETTGTSKRHQLRREITSESESLEERNMENRLTVNMRQLKEENERLAMENSRLRCRGSSQGIGAEAKGVDTEKAKLVNELEYYRKSRPEIAKLVNGLYDSEQKILSYEDEIANLRSEMCKMENSLQEDINSLTMKNSILRSLLEVINEHEVDTLPAHAHTHTHSTAIHSKSDMAGSEKDGERATEIEPINHNTTLTSSTSSKAQMVHSNITDDSLVTQHMSRLPLDIQNQFKKKIECLERQLREEKDRAKAAEGLLQQVKISAACTANQKQQSVSTAATTAAPPIEHIH